MGLQELLSKIEASKVKFWVEDSNLKYLAPKSVMETESWKMLHNKENDILDLFHKICTENETAQFVSYWKEKLTGTSKLLGIPTDYSKSSAAGNKYDVKSFYIDNIDELVADLSKGGFTDEIILLAVFKILFYRYTSEKEILTGYLSSDIEDLKPFSNILILSTQLSSGLSFKELLSSLSDEVNTSKRNSTILIDTVIKESLPEEDLSYHPFYQTMMSYDQLEEEPSEEWETNAFNDEDKYPHVSVYMSLAKVKNKLKGHIWYNASLFKPDTIDRMIIHYKTLFNGGIKNPNEEIGKLPILSDDERQKLFIDGNSYRINFSADKLLYQIFEEQVERTPGKLVLIYKNQKFTYRELNNRINQLSNKLIKEGIKPEIPVGVFTERSSYTVISLLAILKGGGAYVPLDLAYPEEHLKYILEQTEVPVLLSESKLKSKIPLNNIKIFYLDEDWDEIAQESTDNPGVKVSVDNLALLLYTSGSTGKPKGVLHGQRMLLNYFTWYWTNYPFTENDIVCQRTNVNFIPSIWGFLWGLLKGITTIILPDNIVKDPVMLIDTLSKYKVTRMRVVPSLLKMILESGIDLNERLPDLKFLIIAGEPLSLELYKKFRSIKPDVDFINEYGTTETNGLIFFEAKKMHREDLEVVPIGKPICNAKVYLLDSNKEVVPIGVCGEIHVTGICLSRGYLKRPDLTEKRYIKNPFCNDPDSQFESILYNTGDYARYLPDGIIEYLGRRDNQVKIRGVRLELTQIEAEIIKHPDIKECAVAAIDSDVGKKLAAFIVLKEETVTSEKDFRNYFKQRLPEYMMPAFITIIDQMPCTPNGKLNRKPLPSLLLEKQSSPSKEAAEKETGTDDSADALLEKVIMTITDITAEIIGVNAEVIDVYENFSNLGIDSVSIVKLIKLINEEFNSDLTVTALFDYPTIYDLSGLVLTSAIENWIAPCRRHTCRIGSL